MSCSHGGWGWQGLQLTSSLQSQSLQKAERGCQKPWRVLVRVLVRSCCEPAEANAAAFSTSGGSKADLVEVQMRMFFWGQGYADALGFQTRTFLLNYQGCVPITWMLPARRGGGMCRGKREVGNGGGEVQLHFEHPDSLPHIFQPL